MYLYIINYAKSQPDLAVLAVNTFRKDARERVNPLIRGLSVRTMGCIGIEQILDHLCDPLKDSMGDEDPYVRKTAAICVAKLYEINPERVVQLQLVENLKSMLFDGNAMVVSNAVAAISDIEQDKGQLVSLNNALKNQLLTALNDCNEWGLIFILDFMASRPLEDMSQKSLDQVLKGVVPCLNHQNPAVVLSSTKYVMKLLDFVQDPEKTKSVLRKMAPPLISLMNNGPEI